MSDSNADKTPDFAAMAQKREEARANEEARQLEQQNLQLTDAGTDVYTALTKVFADDTLDHDTRIARCKAAFAALSGDGVISRPKIDSPKDAMKLSAAADIDSGRLFQVTLGEETAWADTENPGSLPSEVAKTTKEEPRAEKSVDDSSTNRPIWTRFRDMFHHVN